MPSLNAQTMRYGIVEKKKKQQSNNKIFEHFDIIIYHTHQLSRLRRHVVPHRQSATYSNSCWVSEADRLHHSSPMRRWSRRSSPCAQLSLLLHRCWYQSRPRCRRHTGSAFSWEMSSPAHRHTSWDPCQAPYQPWTVFFSQLRLLGK